MKQIIFLILIATILMTGCVNQEKTVGAEETKGMPIETTEKENPESETETEAIESETLRWMDVELTDVLTGDKFKISDFKGKTVLIESFAVWCPTCKRQQIEVKELHDLSPETVSISLDVDPNEDEAKVLEHAQRNEFDWRFALSPVEVTQALIDIYGVQSVNAPSAPVIMICEDGSSKFLKTGVKSANELLAEIQKGC